MKKRVWIGAALVFVCGIVVGGALVNSRKNTVQKLVEYTSEAPMFLTISEEEMNQKDELVALFEQYGYPDPEVDKTDILMIPKEKKELLALLPEGSVVEYCKQYEGEIEIRYELNGIFYHLQYTKTQVMKAVQVEQDKKEYYILNTDNKEFECHRMESK